MRTALFIAIAVSTGCKQATPLPAAVPKQGKVVVDNASVDAGDVLVVSGSFTVDPAARKPKSIVVKLRRGDGVIMTSKTGTVDVEGTMAKFEVRMKAPDKAGDYKVVASTGGKEISATAVSVGAH